MLTLIIPVYNEADSLVELHAEIDRVCAAHRLDAEIVFVDDGSTDRSWPTIRELSARDPRVRAIRFRRNFGKAAALSAGMQAARGEVLFMLDADLQDDPAEIPRFLEELARGGDVVNGWKRQRLDPWHKVYPSRVFNWMVSRLTGLHLHDHNCGFKCFRREVSSEIRLYGELHRFIPVLAHARGFHVTELEVHHRPRQYGHSKYGVRRFVRGFLDLLTVKFLTGFGQRPQHMLGALGLFLFGLGCLGLSYLAVVWMLTNLPPHLALDPIGTRPLLAYSAASLLLGGQLVSLGFLAELIVAYTGRDSDTYSVVERIGS
ncbi:MAG TPA: glycosyltransferase family 2 protein [Planctomycetaceae bacterium]|jgi:glycosyltransferase involved in cell wall biosynthesis|nr:glycosyltransferase family 2 protein [Planctomycetaceae bacterium]